MTNVRFVLLGSAVLSSCTDTFIRPAPISPRIAQVQIVYQDSALLVGHSLALGVQAWDSDGQLVADPLVYWTSADSLQLSVDLGGIVTASPSAAGGNHPIMVSALSSGAADTLSVHVAVPGEVKWRLPLGFMPTAGGPAQGPDGTIYTLGAVDLAGNMATLFAVSRRGSVLWQQRLTQVNGANYPMVGTNGMVFVVGQYVYAFLPSGPQVWSITVRPSETFPNLPDGHSGAISDNGVLFATMAYDLFALRASDGDTLWVGPRANDGGWLLPTTVDVVGNTAFIKNTGDSLYAFRVSDGTIRWGLPDAIGRVFFGQGPAVAGARLIVPNAELLQEADTTGAFLATGSNLGFGVSEPAIGEDGLLYVQTPAQNYGLFAFNPVNVFRWRALGFRPEFSLYGGPALASERVLYAAANDGFYALQISDTGATVRWRYPLAPAQLSFVGAPLIGVDGTVYTFTSCDYGRSTSSCTDELFAFWADLPVEPNSPWPMWRHDARRSGQAHR